MSLTGRVVLLVVVALIGLGAAGFAVVRARTETGAARAETAFVLGDALARELSDVRRRLTAEDAARVERGELPSAVAASLAARVDALHDGGAGYCRSDGTLLGYRVVVPPNAFPPRPPNADAFGLLPLDRDVVVSACRERAGEALGHVRANAPTDRLFVTVDGEAGTVAAWVLVRVPTMQAASGVREWLPVVIAMALAMVALVGLSLDTVLQLRRGLRLLVQGVTAFRTDLRADIPRPEARELALLADELRGMAGFVADSRERELALERRLAHNHRLVSLGRVTAGVAHEIRNPLAGMKLRLDALARRRLDERSLRDVTRALDEIARLDGFVSSLLLAARREAPPPSEVELDSLVDERLASLESLAQRRGIQLVRTGECRARVDRGSIVRLVDNLVRNAIEASPEDATVRVVLATEAEDVLLDVVDEGPGIAPERHGELFEPFFTTKQSGTGLGLTLSRAVVEAHGGTIAYRRDDDRTRFLVVLPGRALA